jgi:hypothetical protein
MSSFELFQEQCETRDDLIAVLMTTSHARSYERWLRSRGLNLFKIPTPGDFVFYGIGVVDMPSDQENPPKE